MSHHYTYVTSSHTESVPPFKRAEASRVKDQAARERKAAKKAARRAEEAHLLYTFFLLVIFGKFQYHNVVTGCVVKGCVVKCCVV